MLHLVSGISFSEALLATLYVSKVRMHGFGYLGSSYVYISKKDTPPQELRRSDVWCLCNLIRTTSTYKGVCRSLSDDDGWRGQRVPAEQVLRVLECQQR